MNNLITKAEAEALEAKYISTRSSVIDQSLGYTDKRNFYATIQEMKDFIDFVETESSAKGYENIGIRIFLGAYEPTEDDPSYATVFLSATRDHGDVNSTDIKPMNYLKPGINSY